jgi:hypothetical protein
MKDGNEDLTQVETEEEVAEEVVEEEGVETPEPETEEPDHSKLIEDLKAQNAGLSQTVGHLQEQFAMLRETSAIRNAPKEEEIDLFPGMPDDYILSKAEINAAMKAYGQRIESKVVSNRYSDITAVMQERYPDFNEVISVYLNEIITNPTVREKAGYGYYKSGQELYNDLQEIERKNPEKAARMAYEMGKRNPKYTASAKTKDAEGIVKKIADNSKRPATLASAPTRKKPIVENAWDLSDEEFEKQFAAGRR